jgi:hypothetical protein
MFSHVPLFLEVSGAVAGTWYGLAALVRAWFDGKARVIRATRGDPEPQVLRVGSGSQIDNASLPDVLK